MLQMSSIRQDQRNKKQIGKSTQMRRIAAMVLPVAAYQKGVGRERNTLSIILLFFRIAQ